MAAFWVSWQFWALLAAGFAALTAIFGKVGVAGIDSDFATFLRTIVVAVLLGLLIWATGKAQSLSALSSKTLVFLTLSGIATGASWLCYFRALQIGKAAQVAPVDKLSVVFVAVFATLFLGESLSPLAWGGIGFIALGAVMVSLG
ncbi:EamA family transporter [Abyssibius alkaniclasticus]|uniref:EamA family transporter n=1 Tax=Abyssibius alkaniclasticus TaxID=2881234 RepID=UPI0023643DA3|nr:EamA family transporter [Abyssibius alkaniclasticus]UPH70340.1 EamA family transporter [Abyssibius alkaniclasticus]